MTSDSRPVPAYGLPSLPVHGRIPPTRGTTDDERQGQADDGDQDTEPD